MATKVIYRKKRLSFWKRINHFQTTIRNFYQENRFILFQINAKFPIKHALFKGEESPDFWEYEENEKHSIPTVPRPHLFTRENKPLCF